MSIVAGPTLSVTVAVWSDVESQREVTSWKYMTVCKPVPAAAQHTLLVSVTDDSGYPFVKVFDKTFVWRFRLARFARLPV